MDFNNIRIQDITTAEEFKHVLQQIVDGMEALSFDIESRMEHLTSQNVKHLDFAVTAFCNSRKLILANQALISELAVQARNT